MKNILTVIVAVVCVFLIYIGISQRDNQQPEKQATETPKESIVPVAGGLKDTNNVSAPVSNVASVVGSPATPIKQEMKKYYPENTAIAGGSGSTGSSATASAEQNFQITPSLLAKMHLADKYKPGICYGLPSVPPQSAIDSLKTSNEPLWQFIKQQYNLTTDLEIYNKIKQLQGVSLTETQSGVFNFAFMDGQCQTVRYYEGVVQVVGAVVTDTVTSQESHTYN